MLTQLHLLLAWLTAATTALLALEAARRALRGTPATQTAALLSLAQLVAVAITSVVGLGLVMLGEQVEDTSHYLLALLALALLPAASMVTHGARPRLRAASTAVVGALALGAVWLLFVTG